MRSAIQIPITATLLLTTALLSQDPYKVAGDHYHLVFENEWAKATRVTYGPHETAPVHDHPRSPLAIFVYVTDGGVMQFHHLTGYAVKGFNVDRKPVKAGAIRVAHGVPETHSVNYLGDEPTEYARIELKTEPADIPMRDVRLPPYTFDNTSMAVQQFENGQVRIVRVKCEAAKPCPASEHPDDPAVVVILSESRRGEILWSPKPQPMSGPMEQVRIELKTPPANGQ